MARMWSVMVLVVLAAVPAWAQDRDRGWAHLSFGGAFSTAGEETRRLTGRPARPRWTGHSFPPRS